VHGGRLRKTTWGLVGNTDGELKDPDYYKKNPLRNHYYRQCCGRYQRLEALWGDYAVALTVRPGCHCSAAATPGQCEYDGGS
jgi:hypothetical protein